MQAIIFLKEPLKLAEGITVGVFVANVQPLDMSDDYAVIVFPDGQLLKVVYENLFVAEDISSATWILKNSDGSYMTGVVDSTFSG